MITFLKSNYQIKDWKKRIVYCLIKKKTSYRSAIGQLNCVAGVSRPDISFSVCEASTKFKQATLADVLYVNNKNHKELHKRN